MNKMACSKIRFATSHFIQYCIFQKRGKVFCQMLYASAHMNKVFYKYAFSFFIFNQNFCHFENTVCIIREICKKVRKEILLMVSDTDKLIVLSFLKFFYIIVVKVEVIIKLFKAKSVFSSVTYPITLSLSQRDSFSK